MWLRLWGVLLGGFLSGVGESGLSRVGTRLRQAANMMGFLSSNSIRFGYGGTGESESRCNS